MEGGEGPSAGPAPRRASRRLSAGIVQAAMDVGLINTTKEKEEKEKKVEQEDEEFAARHPTWEEALPPLYVAPAAVTEETAILSVLEEPTASSLLLKELLPAVPKIESKPKQDWIKAYKSVRSSLIMRRQLMRSAAGTGAQIDGYALGLWDPHSNFRLKLFHFLYNQNTEYLLLCMICTHLLILIFKSSEQTQWTHSRQFDLDFADLVVTIFYSVELFLRIICLGFWKGPHAFLKNNYNKLDFIIVVDSWAHIIGNFINGKRGFARIAVLRAFRALLCLRHFSFFADVIAILDAIRKSIGPLENVILLTFLLLSFYSLMGIQFLAGTLNKRCIRSSDNQMSNPERFCDTHTNAGYACPRKQKCLVSSNANYGLTNFDTFPFALLTMFQFIVFGHSIKHDDHVILSYYTRMYFSLYTLPRVGSGTCLGSDTGQWLTQLMMIITLEGWSLVMYEVKDSVSASADAYFITLVLFGTYLLVNVFIAAISGIFLRVRIEHQMLIKRTRRADEVSFYKATVIANAMRDVIVKDDAQLNFFQRVVNKSRRFGRDLSAALRQSHSSLRTAFSSRMSSLSSSFSYGESDSFRHGRVVRSLTMGVKAAVTVSTKARRLLRNRHVDNLILGIIIANALNLCMYQIDMTNARKQTIYALEGIFLACMVGEMVLRFVATGPRKFANDSINVYDTIVLMISAGAVFTHTYPNVSAARLIRLFYRSKAQAAKNPTTVVACIQSVGSLASVFFFYLFLIIVFSIVSMELYGGQYYNFEEGYPRGNHDSMIQTMLLWFSVTTGESWVNQMWNSMRNGVANRWVSSYLYVFYYVLTSFLVLNLIIAVILEKSELTDNQKKKIQKAEYMKFIKRSRSRALTRTGSWVVGAVEGAQANMKNLVNNLRGSMKVKAVEKGTIATIEETPPSSENSKVNEQQPVPAQSTGASVRRASQVLQTTGFSTDISKTERRGSKTALESAVLAVLDPKPAEPVQKQRSFGRSMSRSASTAGSFRRSGSKRSSFQLAEYEELEKSVVAKERPWYLSGRTLLLFPEDSMLRTNCYSITQSKWWARFTLIWSLVAIFVLIESNPLGASQLASPVARGLDRTVIAVFLVDFIMKLIGHGILVTPDPYVGDPFNLLDLGILIIEILNLIPFNQRTDRVLRALLAFRPLRVLCRFQGMKLLFTNLIKTMPAIGSVLFFTFVIFVIFGTVGVQLFRGRLWSCNDYEIKNRVECVGLYVNPMSIIAPREWSSQNFHFDDIGNALLSLFVISTFDGWLQNWLYPSMDITRLNEQPVANQNAAYALYYVAFCCVGGFFIVRMFIGVFIDEFGVRSGSKLLTERQKLWRDMNRIIQKSKPTRLLRPPDHSIGKFCYRILRHPLYPKFMIAVILGYYGFLATHQEFEAETVRQARKKTQIAFIAFFWLEVLLNFLGTEPQVYIRSFGNVFELAITLVGSACLSAKRDSPMDFLGRICYIARLFSLVRHMPKAKVLMNTLYVCLPSMIDIMGLLMILLSVFAGIGVQLFSRVKDGACIGPLVNFRSFIESFVTAFQVTTADNWSCLMSDLMVAPPYCVDSPDLAQNDCGYPLGAIIYFVVLIFLATFIIMNLFVAIILDAITFGLLSENAMITPQHLADYILLWSKEDFDPRATGFIGMHKLRQFVNRLGVPLGRRHKAPIQWFTRIEYEVMDFHIPSKGVPFKQLLETLTLYKIGPSGLPIPIRIEREKQIINIYRKGAAVKIQASTRTFLARKKFLKQRPQKPKIGAMLVD